MARTWIGVVVVLAGVLVSAPAKAPLDAETQARVEVADAGIAEVDVSGYPDGIQANYKVFAKKCSQCHTLARPINSLYGLPSEWSRYVKRMMRKPGSGIRKGDAKQIYEFLVYDSSTRKREFLESKLENLTEEQQQAERVKISEVNALYP